MAEKFLEVLKEVGIFLIIGQTILHFSPAKKYEKYMKMMISIMVMTQLMIPIVSIFNADLEGVMENELNKYMEELSEFEQQQNILEAQMLEYSQQEYTIFQQEMEQSLEGILQQEDENQNQVEELQQEQNQSQIDQLQKEDENQNQVEELQQEDERIESIKSVEVEKIEILLE
ncbi:MAG: hypothetical protein R3Y24_10190 [Eubacteriales bacterium]